jgi:excisionase family DNA binding protein
MELPKMLTIQQAAAATGMSYHAIWQLCRENKIVHIRVGSKYLINEAKLVQYLNGEESAAVNH